MRRGHGSRFTPFQVGLIALVVIVIGTFLGASKDIPFTRPFQLKAVFENAPPIYKGRSPDRRGGRGQDLARRARGRRLAGRRRDDEARRTRRCRSTRTRRSRCARGSSSRATSSSTSGPARRRPARRRRRHDPVSQTSAPVQLDQVLGHAHDGHARGPPEAPDRLRRRAERPAAARRGRRPGSGHEGRDRRQVAERLVQVLGSSLRGGAILNDATRGTELHDLSKLIGSQQKIFAALSSREGSLKDLITNFNTTMGALAAQESNLRATIHELPQVLEAAGPRSTT